MEKENLSLLVNMGFDEKLADKFLKKHKNDFNKALDDLLMNQDVHKIEKVNFNKNEKTWIPLNPSNEPPIARTCHSAFIYDDKMYIINGQDSPKQFDDMFYYDFRNNTWNKVNVELRLTTKQNILLYKDFLIIHGGQSDSIEYSDAIRFNLITNQYSIIKIEGLNERHSHGSTLWNGKAFYFGGLSNNATLNDFYSVDLTNFEESKSLFAKKYHTVLPEPVGYIKSVQYNDSLFIFCGYGDKKFFNEVFEYNFERNKWNIYKTDIFEGRYGNCLSFYKNLAYVYAGTIQNTKYGNDLYEFNMDLKTYSKIETLEAPEGSWCASTCFYKKNIYLFGGYLKPSGKCSNLIHKIEIVQDELDLYKFIKDKRGLDIHIRFH